MRRKIFKILAIVVAVAGIPAGLLLSRGLRTPWNGNSVAVTSPDAIHWHVAIGIWIAFALTGLFIWCFDKSFKQENFPFATTVIYIGGLISGFLIGFRQGASSPWAPSGYGAPQVVIPSAIVWTLTLVVCGVFFALATMLLVLRKFSKTQQN
ncbi:MAG: hypothetical protein FWE16_01300 [Firmicutes bacterium]|nr:hypothetical protein [Bacillota bacterium]